jgi:hypothetical protein
LILLGNDEPPTNFTLSNPCPLSRGLVILHHGRDARQCQPSCLASFNGSFFFQIGICFRSGLSRWLA